MPPASSTKASKSKSTPPASSDPGKFFLLHLTDSEFPPKLESFDDNQALRTRLAELRTLAMQRGDELAAYVFQGRRLRLSRGHTAHLEVEPGVWLPLMSDEISDDIADDGKLVIPPLLVPPLESLPVEALEADEIEEEDLELTVVTEDQEPAAPAAPAE